MKFWGHLKTVIKHKWLVMCGCFRVGLYWRGLVHDMSKFSWTEFSNSVRYFQGNRSPNNAEREDKGYSESWMHHKGRNRHHFEYWVDYDPVSRTYQPIPVPRKFLAEMVMDRRAACMTYQGKNYKPGAELEYFENSVDRGLMHPQTRQELEYLLKMLKDRGEKATFRYIKKSVLKGKPFPWEE